MLVHDGGEATGPAEDDGTADDRENRDCEAGPARR